MLGDMNDAVVDGDAARNRAVEELVLPRTLVGENVEAERSVPPGHVLERLVEILISHHREERPEDFFLEFRQLFVSLLWIL